MKSKACLSLLGVLGLLSLANVGCGGDGGPEQTSANALEAAPSFGPTSCTADGITVSLTTTPGASGSRATFDIAVGSKTFTLRSAGYRLQKTFAPFTEELRTLVAFATDVQGAWITIALSGDPGRRGTITVGLPGDPVVTKEIRSTDVCDLRGAPGE